MICFIMGVSGSGKTTIGRLLAERLGFAFHDGDDYHSPVNKAKMAAGEPLTDADRQPWLEALNRLAVETASRGANAVIVCSALKQAYREMLSRDVDPATVRFILIEGSRDLIAGRLAARTHEYMNPALLDSQIATLEQPADAIRVVNDSTPDEAVRQVLTRLGVV